MPISAAERSENARIAALTRSSREPSGTAMTAKARQTFWDSFAAGHECRFCEPVVIDQELPDAERQRQAAAARAVHYSLIARNARRAAASARASRAPDAAAL
jgi:hypothetical protein